MFISEFSPVSILTIGWSKLFYFKSNKFLVLILDESFQGEQINQYRVVPIVWAVKNMTSNLRQISNPQPLFNLDETLY